MTAYQKHEIWRCVYCGKDFPTSLELKVHFSLHKNKYNNHVNKCCSCGKYFSEFHYFENHLLQTGHMNDKTIISNRQNQIVDKFDNGSPGISVRSDTRMLPHTNGVLHTYGTVMDMSIVGCAFRVLKSDHTIGIEGSTILQKMKFPNLQHAELEALKSGILAAIQIECRHLNWFTCSSTVVSILLDPYNQPSLITSDESIKDLLTEVLNIIKEKFNSFDIKVVDFQHDYLKKMVANGMVIKQLANSR